MGKILAVYHALLGATRTGVHAEMCVSEFQLFGAVLEKIENHGRITYVCSFVDFVSILWE